MKNNPKPRIGDPDFDPIAQETTWKTLPKSMILIEYLGDGDPAFGGAADDRVVLENGRVADRLCAAGDTRAVFQTVAQAHATAANIPNRRTGSILGVAPVWR